MSAATPTAGFITGNTLDRAADAMLYAALGWLAATSSPTDAALVLGLGALPRVAILLGGGVAVDRLGLGRVAAWTLAARTAAAAALWAALADGHAEVAVLAAVAVVVGALDGLHLPAMAGLSGLIVRGPRATSVQGTLAAWAEAADVAAPVAAGWLLGVTPALLGPVVTVAGVAALLAVTRSAVAKTAARIPATTREDLPSGWSAGIRLAARRPAVIALFLAVNALVTAPVLAGTPIMAVTHAWPGWAYGIAVAAFGVGNVLGGAGLSRWGDQIDRPIRAAILLLAPAPVLLAGFAATTSWALACIALLGIGLCLGPSAGILMAHIKATCPENALGRVMATVQLGAYLGVAGSYALYGVLLDQAGPRAATLWLVAALTVAVAVAARWRWRHGEPSTIGLSVQDTTDLGIQEIQDRDPDHTS